MITISTRDYTTEQLKDLAYGLSMAQDKIFERYKCEYSLFVPENAKPMRYVMTFLTHGVTCTIR